MSVGFWERPELVDRFAAREPDVRLIELLDSQPAQVGLRVLDLGCAGGRNTVALAERGLEVFAVDASTAMVERTRIRLRPILADEADTRVMIGRMQDLSRFPDEHFGLVVALGIFHQASSLGAWEQAISESVRVLEPGGLLLYASFDPETAPDGHRGVPKDGEPHMYGGFRSGSVFLIEADELEARLSRVGLIPETPTVTVRVETEKGVRVTVNALFRRANAFVGAQR